MNLIILGVGHSGTTILTQFLARLGWYHNAHVDSWAECQAVRTLNAEMIHGPRNRQPDIPRMNRIIDHLASPWVVKDPRFVLTLHQWQQSRLAERTALLWLQRDPDDVRASYIKRGEVFQSGPHKGKAGMYNLPVEQLFEAARDQFNAWQGPKIILQHEDLMAATALYSRGGGSSQT